LALLLFVYNLVPAQTAPTPSAASEAPAGPDAVVTLNPFEVDANAEHGYLATQTLSGTRLKSELGDVGSSQTIFTQQLMNDLGANSVHDLMAFAPNTDTFVMNTNDTSGTGNDFINIPTKYVTRGGATTIVGQDFFTNNIPQDRFDSEALTFTRGPNAILFGLGNSSGAFLTSSKRAKWRDSMTVENQVDSRGGHRMTVDANVVVKKDFLSLRYAAVLEGDNDFRIQNNTYQRRQYATLTFTPFKTTALRVNYERGHIQQSGVRPWPDYDAVTPWINAGRPMISTFSNTPTGKPPGTQNYGIAGLVSTQFTPGGTAYPTQVLTNQGQTAPASYAYGLPTNSTSFRSLLNPAIYPTFASDFGNTAYRLTDYHQVTAFLEQQIAPHLFLEVAANRVNEKEQAVNGFVGQFSYIYADPNLQLPNGQANPDAGKLYSQSSPTIIDAPSLTENERATMSYDFDFSKHFGNWLRFFGRHQFAAFAEEDDVSGWSSNNGLFNVTPLATTGPAATINNGANGIQFREYFDPSQNKVGTSIGRHLEAIPVLYANTPLPARDPSGITEAFIAQQGGNMTENLTKTHALAGQSFFWSNKIVFTYGLRTDDVSTWSAVPQDFANLRDSNNIAPRPSLFDVRKLPTKAGRSEAGGHTYSDGLVYHVFPWISLAYNNSDNFQVSPATSRDFFGRFLPNPQGKGSDYSARFTLLDGRLYFDLTYYTNQSVNASDAVNNTPAGGFSGPLIAIFNQVYTYTGNTAYQSFPYNSTGTVVSDTVSTKSSGWEFSLTANPTKNWRIVLNGSRQGDQQTSSRGGITTQYLATYIPFIESHPEWLPLATAGGLTIAQQVAALQANLANFQAIKNVPSGVFMADWTLNLIQTYEFTKGGPLGGFSVGGSMNERGPAIDGFQVDSAKVFVPSAPYYAHNYAIFGGWITYQHKLFHNRVNWRLQMNVRNIFNEQTIYPLVTVDSEDGRHTPSVAIWNLREPRTYLFTSTFTY
jgi:hypothetical protein